MKRALVVGASGGIGRSVVAAWRARGVQVTALSRSGDGLDVRDEVSIADVLGALDGPFDVILVATGALDGAGAPPEKSLGAVTSEAMMAQYAVNAVGPMLVLKHAVRLLPRRERSVFAALSARVGSIGDNRAGGWHSFRAAKAGLNQMLHGASIELGRSHPGVICAALHPGTVATTFTQNYAGRHSMVSPEEAAQNLIVVMEGLKPEQTGGFYDYEGREIPW